jgi:hypothetical protein
VTRDLAPTRSHVRSAVAAVTLAGVLCGCATAPPPPAPVADFIGADRARVRAEQTQAAQGAFSAGRLREALWRWRAVEAVADDPTTARRQIASVEAAIATAVAVQEAKGDAADADRDLAASRAAYRQAFALDPGRRGAAQHLREAETASVLKDVAYEQRPASQHPRARAPASRMASPKSTRKPSSTVTNATASR